MKTYIVEVSEVHAHLVRASNIAYANRIALAQSRGQNPKVVKTTDVTHDMEEP
jgi:hypothetical protein